MSEVTETSEGPPRRHWGVRNPQDFYGGLALLALAAFAIWASRDLPGMRGFAFGPGTAPRLFSGLLGAIGAIIALMGFFTNGPGLERFGFRGPIFVIAAVLFFAGAIRPIGLVVTTFLTILISAAASAEVRWVETAIWAIGLTIFCALLFPYALNLPLQLWPRF